MARESSATMSARTPEWAAARRAEVAANKLRKQQLLAEAQAAVSDAWADAKKRSRHQAAETQAQIDALQAQIDALRTSSISKQQANAEAQARVAEIWTAYSAAVAELAVSKVPHDLGRAQISDDDTPWVPPQAAQVSNTLTEFAALSGKKPVTKKRTPKKAAGK